MPFCLQSRCFLILMPTVLFAWTLNGQESAVSTLSAAKNEGHQRLFAISEDGKYIAHVATPVQRNKEGDLLLGVEQGKHKIPGSPWRIGLVQVIRRVDDGKIAAVISQPITNEQNNSPFNKPVYDFEKRLFNIAENQIVRFPQVEVSSRADGWIITTFFGPQDDFRVVMRNKKVKSKNPVTLVNLTTGSSKPNAYFVTDDPFGYWTSGNLEMLKGAVGCLDRAPTSFVNLSGRGPERIVIDLKIAGARPVWEKSGGLSVSLDNRYVLANYTEGMALWQVKGTGRHVATVPHPESRKAHFIKLLPKLRALVLSRDNGEARLYDLNGGRLLDRIDLPGTPVFDRYECIETADHGRYACFVASGRQYQAVCLKVDQDKIEGPWLVPDPDTGFALEGVKSVKAALVAPVLAIDVSRESDDRVPRILAVNLDQLTSVPTQNGFSVGLSSGGQEGTSTSTQNRNRVDPFAE